MHEKVPMIKNGTMIKKVTMNKTLGAPLAKPPSCK